MLDPILQGDNAVRQLRMRERGDDRGSEDSEREAETDSSKCQNDGPTVLLERCLWAPC